MMKNYEETIEKLKKYNQNEIVNILEKLLWNEEQVVSALDGVIEQVADIKKVFWQKHFVANLRQIIQKRNHL